MADKYVKLDDIIETLEHEWGYEGMREDLYNLPTADVAEVKHGKWVYKDEDLGCDIYMCSSCKEEYCLETGSPQDNFYNYCPNCGAKMDGKED